MNVTTLKKPAAPEPPKKTSYLADVVSGKVEVPDRVILCGPPGIGKSSCAAGAPLPIWVDLDHGTEHLDVKRIPDRVWTFADVRGVIAELAEGGHPYKTIVIDTLTKLEPIVWQETCRRCGETDIEKIGGGFKKGFEAALLDWRLILADLDRLRQQTKMNVILIAHSVIRKQKTPDAQDFERYTLDVHPLAAALFLQWSDHVLFAKRNVWSEATDKKNTRFRAIGDGERYLHTAWSPAYDAKSRPQLPDPLPFRERDAWATFSRAREFVSNRLAEKQAELEALLSKAAADIVEQVRAFIAEDPKDVTRYDEAIQQLKANQ